MRVDVEPRKASGRGETGAHLAATLAALVFLGLAFAPVEFTPTPKATSIEVAGVELEPGETVTITARLLEGPPGSGPVTVPKPLHFYVAEKTHELSRSYVLRYAGAAVTDREGVAKTAYTKGYAFNTYARPGYHAYTWVGFTGDDRYQESSGVGEQRFRPDSLPGLLLGPVPSPTNPTPDGDRNSGVDR